MPGVRADNMAPPSRCQVEDWSEHCTTGNVRWKIGEELTEEVRWEQLIIWGVNTSFPSNYILDLMAAHQLSCDRVSSGLGVADWSELGTPRRFQEKD